MAIRERFWRWFRTADLQGPRVLLYHRITETERDPQLLCVAPDIFTEQMEWLAMNCTLLPMPVMLELARAGSLPRNAVAVTFDDGYLDNFEIAAPILEKYEIPATFYVSSGFVDSGKELWWDELERLLLSDLLLPAHLSLQVDSETFEWDLRDNVRDDQWNVTAAPTTPAQEAYLVISRKLKFMGSGPRDDVLERLRCEIGGGGGSRSTHRGVSSTVLRDYAAHGLIDIGGHTVDHVALSAISRAEQAIQIFEDRARIAAMLGATPSGFAYPYGTEGDYDSRSISEVRDAGYTYACANWQGVVTGSTAIFEVPRQIVRNWGAHRFSGTMSRWLG